MIAQRGQISMRYSQRRWLFLTLTLNLWNFLPLLAVGAGSFTQARGDRTSSQKMWKSRGSYRSIELTSSSERPRAERGWKLEMHRGYVDALLSVSLQPPNASRDPYASIPISYPFRKYLQKRGGKGKQVKKGRRTWRGKGRNSEPERKNGRDHCSRMVFKGLAEVTKECSAHQSGEDVGPEIGPRAAGISPRWIFLLLGLERRLCRTGRSPTGWQDLGWVEIKRWGDNHSLSLTSELPAESEERLQPDPPGARVCQGPLCTAEEAHAKGRCHPPMCSPTKTQGFC